MRGSTARREIPPLLVLAAFTLAVVALARPLPVPPALRAAAAVSLVLLFPGVGLSLLWPGLPRNGWPAGLALSLPLSLAGVMFVTAVGWVIHWRALALGAAHLYFGFLAVIAALVLATRREGGTATPARAAAGLAALLVAGAALLAVAGAPTGPTTDGPDHLATVNEILTSGSLFPHHAVLPPGDPDRTDPRKGIFHVALALAAALAGVPAGVVWRVAPAVLVLPWLALVWVLGRRIGLSARGAWIAALIALLFTGGVPAAWAPKLAYGSHVGLLVAWAAVWVLLGLLEEFSTASWVLLGLLTATSAAVHPMAPAFLFLPLVLLALWRLGRERFLRLAGAAAAALVLSAPVLVWRLAELRGPWNPLHTPSMPALELGPLGSVLAPAYVVAWLGPVGILGLCLLPGARRWIPAGPGRSWLVASAVVSVVPAVVPGVFDLTARAASSLPIKLLYAAPYPWVLGAFLDGPWRGRARWPRALTALALALLLPFALARFQPARVAGARPAGTDEALDAIRGIKPPTVVAADPWMLCLVAAETPHWPFTVFQQHGSPVDPHGLDRLNRLGTILSPWVSAGEAARELAAAHVGLVLVPAPGAASPLEIDFAAARGGVLDAARRETFHRHPDLFPRMWRSATWEIYAVRPRPQGPDPLPVWPPVTGAPRGVGVTDLDGRAGGVRLLAVEPPDTLVAGTTARAVLWWERERGAPADWPVEVHLRATRLGALEPPRPWRLFCEHVVDPDRPRSRQRAVASPFLGAWPAASWPEGEALADTIRFQVSPLLVAGSYALAVRVRPQPMFSHMGLGDLLRDEDRWQGAPLDTVLVESSRR